MAEIVALSGQSFRQVWDDMTWADYRALYEFWKDWPPPAVSLAFLAKLAPQQRDTNPGGAAGEDAIAELTSLIGAPPPQE